MRSIRLYIWLVVLVLALATAGCVPLSSGATLPPADDTAGDTVGGATDEEAAAPEIATTGAIATITARSLRVREAPSEDSEVVFGVREGEEYEIVELSEDGAWVHLAIPGAPGGEGWVSASYVSVNGALVGPAPADEEAEEPAEAAATEETTAASETATTPVLLPTPEPGFARVVSEGVRLRVRAEPSTEAEIVGYIYDGEIHEVVETSEDGAWVRVAGSDDEVSDNPLGGWVAAEFLLIGQ